MKKISDIIKYTDAYKALNKKESQLDVLFQGFGSIDYKNIYNHKIKKS